MSSFLQRELPTTRLREITASGNGYDRSFWEVCAKQGWYGLGLTEDDGGVGYSLAEEALLFRELGRFLVPGPVLGTVLGARVAAAAGVSDLAGEIVAGSSVVGLGEVRAGAADILVWDTGPTDLLLVVDRAAGTAQLAEPTGSASVDSSRSIDPAYRMARLPRASLGEPVASADAAAVVDRGAVLVAAALAGIAEAERDMSARYATERVQFGKAIGTFQAVKHRAADTAIRAEAAWAQTTVAALQVQVGARDAAFHASSAKVVAADAAIRNGRDNIQNHGAIGYTAEHDAHLFLTRAHLLDHVLGDSRAHLAIVLGAELGG